MILLTTMLALGSAVAAPEDPTYACPVMGSPITTAAETFDYRGVRYFSCCAGCATQFKADPEKYTKSSADKNLTIGQALYDPVSRVRVKPGGDLPHELYSGVNYTFQNADDKTKFDADRDSFTKSPDMEVLTCPVLGTVIAEPGLSAGYFDKDGVRFYLCCSKCIDPAKEKGDDFATKAKPSAVKAEVHICSPDDLKKE